MAVTLQKGGSVSLSKFGEKLTKVRVGLGWDARDPRDPGADFDLDASALGCRGSRVFSEAWFVFYNNQTSPNNAIYSMGDNLTGDDEGTGTDDDDETIVIDLAVLHPAIDSIPIVVSINDAEARRQNFGNVSNAYIRVINDESGHEILRYNLTNEATFETAMVIGEIYRENGEWRFRATGKPYAGGLYEIVTSYGVEVK